MALPEGSNPIGKSRSAPTDGKLPKLPPHLSGLVVALGERATREAMRQAIVALCAWKELRPTQLAQYLRRNPTWVMNAYPRPMLQEGLLELVYPDIPAHPFQAYRAAWVYERTVLRGAAPSPPRPLRSIGLQTVKGGAARERWRRGAPRQHHTAASHRATTSGPVRQVPPRL